MSGFTFEDLEDLDEGANDAPAQGGFDALEDLDAAPANDSFRSISDPATELGPQYVSKTPDDQKFLPTGYIDGDETRIRQNQEALADGGYKLAGGVLAGVGINPRDVSTGVRDRLDAADRRSPVASAIGGGLGEAAIQGVAGVGKLGPLLGGAVSGGLSAVGNTMGDWGDRAMSAAKGAAGGATLGALLQGAGKLAQPLRESSNRSYLRQGGATDGTLNKLDAEFPGGAQALAESGRRQGIGSGFMAGPGGFGRDANQAINGIEDARGAIVQGANAPSIDPRALGARIQQEGGAHLPNMGSGGVVGRQRAAIAAEANAARGMGTPQQGAPWDDVNKYRQTLGRQTDFRNDPGITDDVRQGMYNAVLGEQGDALGLVNPGAGDAWRGLGRDERAALELQKMAGRGENRGGGFGFGDTVAAMGGAAMGGPAGAGLAPLLKRGVQSTFPAVAKNTTGTLSALASGAGSEAAGVLAGGAVGRAAAPPKLDQAALDMLSGSSQGAELGQWRDQIAAAAGSPSPGAVKDTITRLTMSDPEFRTKILPLLRQQAGGR